MAVDPPDPAALGPDTFDSLPQCVCYLHDFTFPPGEEGSPVVSISTLSVKDDILGKSELPRVADWSPLTFRWLHVPVNNMAWVKRCVEKLSANSCGVNDNIWLCKARPSLSLDVPPHSRFMEPSCDLQDPSDTCGEKRSHPLLSLYLPYLNWDTYENFTRLRDTYNVGPEAVSNSPESKREGLQQSVSSKYLNHDPPLHPRRSLDQFYYSSLSDTRERDADQTVSKWTGSQSKIAEDGRDEAERDSLIVMVDQLWVWVLNEHFIVSFFPSHDFQFSDPSTFSADSPSSTSKFRDLYSSIKFHSGQCKNVYDLNSLIVEQAMTSLFGLENRKFGDLLGIYRWAIGNKSARQTIYFQDFHREQSDISLSSPAYNDRKELKLVLEVADVLDELNMLYRLMEKQQEVLGSLRSALHNLIPGAEDRTVRPNVLVHQRGDGHMDLQGSGSFSVTQDGDGFVRLNADHGNHTKEIRGLAGKLTKKAMRELGTIMKELGGMKSDAKYTHKMLLDLLDLKQKSANLVEVRSSTKQGRAVMLFTIFTIIFLPLSFFTSYFGQNVSEITGDDQNPTGADLWMIGGPISVAVILSALLIAYYISNPESRLWHLRRWWRPRVDGSSHQMC
ncbi:hypothetical protein BKA56DRAFT_575472 [Ilyonectria sp. MPI-CAGE-AT-0026]|nr:hypothetical protein BKA56DRAFT_575472 [Ilyonectria sp. MPI-CAGE-AT-0026]